MFEKKIRSNKIIHKEEKSKLLEIISDTNNNFVKLEKTSKQFIDELSANKNSFLSLIERFLPVGLTFLMFQKNKKSNTEFDNFKTQIKKIYDNLNSIEKAQFRKFTGNIFETIMK